MAEEFDEIDTRSKSSGSSAKSRIFRVKMVCGKAKLRKMRALRRICAQITSPQSIESLDADRARYAAILCRAAPLIIVAPFSAIMIVGALVLVEVTAGITEASMTRSA